MIGANSDVSIFCELRPGFSGWNAAAIRKTPMVGGGWTRRMGHLQRKPKRWMQRVRQWDG
jgi:hypothetical protein